MPDTCPDCGAPVPDGGSCRDNFHELLSLEWRIPGGPGELAHLQAVACHDLQHPDGMNHLSSWSTTWLMAGSERRSGTASAARRPGVPAPDRAGQRGQAPPAPEMPSKRLYSSRTTA